MKHRLRQRLRNWATNLLVLGLSSAVALLVGEMAVRLVAPQQLIVLRGDIWIPDHSGLGWRVAPNLDTVVNTGERPVRIVTDKSGYRIAPDSGLPGFEGPAAGGSDAPVRILALGDSFLAAIQVEYEDSVTARLETLLSENLERPVTVVNTGVAGWEVNRYLLLARAELARRSADLVVAFLFRGNDVLTDEREAYPPKQGKIRHRLRWPQSLQAAEILESFLYPLNDSLERRSHLFVLARKAGWQVLMNLGLSARRFPVSELRSEAESTRWRITGQLCEAIADTAAENGAQALFVLVPGAYHVDPEVGDAYARAIGLDSDDFDLTQTSRLMSAELERRGLRYVDATGSLTEARRDGVQTHGVIDTHLTPEGHAVLADAVREPILDLLRQRGIEPSGGGL